MPLCDSPYLLLALIVGPMPLLLLAALVLNLHADASSLYSRGQQTLVKINRVRHCLLGFAVAWYAALIVTVLVLPVAPH